MVAAHDSGNVVRVPYNILLVIPILAGRPGQTEGIWRESLATSPYRVRGH